MKIQVNGETKCFNNNENTLILDDIIKKLGWNPLLVVVEYNGLILPPAKRSSQKLNDGDILEIVTIVGGGN